MLRDCLGIDDLALLLEEFRLLKSLSKAMTPVMMFFGLPHNCSFLWLVGNIVGLSYGSAIMMEQLEANKISRRDGNLLNYHLAISHSQLEDILIFAAIGALPSGFDCFGYVRYVFTDCGNRAKLPVWWYSGCKYFPKRPHWGECRSTGETVRPRQALTAVQQAPAPEGSAGRGTVPPAPGFLRSSCRTP